MGLEWKVTKKLDNAALGKQVNKALDAYAKALDPVLDKQFTDEKWNWPRRTLRRNGRWAETTRDIVDTGELMRSKIGPIKGQGNAYIGTRRWIWNSPYAEAVKNGTGTGHVPRDWIKAALKELPFEAFVARFLKR